MVNFVNSNPMTISFRIDIYSDRVDMYSLGVIFYEMCYGPYETDAERAHELTQIRRKDFTIPLNSVQSYVEVLFIPN